MKLFKIIIIGIITTLSRVLMQLLMPEGTQTVLEPSIFVKNGTMPIAFMIYGILAYSIIASLYLLIENRLYGNKIMKGLKYGIACSAIWVIYLLEPLPHAGIIDKIVYPLVDGIALMIMGLLLGLLLSKDNNSKAESKRIFFKDNTKVIFIAAFFIIGRLIQYLIFDIYSSFNTETLYTIIWAILTGIVIAIVIIWLGNYIKEQNVIKRALILGGILFGINLLLFNFFIPLVFDNIIVDLIIRTFVDIIFVTAGIMLYSIKKSHRIK